MGKLGDLSGYPHVVVTYSFIRNPTNFGLFWLAFFHPLDFMVNITICVYNTLLIVWKYVHFVAAIPTSTYLNAHIYSRVDPHPSIPRVHSSLHLPLTNQIAPTASACAVEFASFVSSLCWASLAKPVFLVSMSLVHPLVSTCWSLLTRSLTLSHTYPLPFWITV